MDDENTKANSQYRGQQAITGPSAGPGSPRQDDYAAIDRCPAAGRIEGKGMIAILVMTVALVACLLGWLATYSLYVDEVYSRLACERELWRQNRRECDDDPDGEAVAEEIGQWFKEGK